MSRATRISVFIVCGCRLLTSSAHTSLALRSAPPAVTVTAAAKLISDDRRRKARRLTASCRRAWRPLSPLIDVPPIFIRHSRRFARFTYLNWPLLEPTMPLQHLDLVSVRILDEEKPREQPALAIELNDLAWRKSRLSKARMLAFNVVDREGDMTVAIT